jgi:hypothetical protein
MKHPLNLIYQDLAKQHAAQMQTAVLTAAEDAIAAGLARR